MDKAEVNYSSVSIVQAYDLKVKLEEIGIRIDELIIASIHAANVYPSIKLTMIKKEVRYLLKGLTTATKKKINLCLDLIRFGMNSTLVFLLGCIMNTMGVKIKNQYQQQVGINWLSYPNQLLLESVTTPKNASDEQTTTESITMTVWWYLEARRRLKIFRRISTYS